MRWLVRSLVLAGMAVQPALAADYYEPLRGSQRYEPGRPIYYRWDGFYIGAFAGVTRSSTYFNDVTKPLIADILRQTELETTFAPSDWPKLPNSYSGKGFIGGFFGYNAQWDDAVIGVEMDFTKLDIFAESFDIIGRTVRLADDYLYSVTVASHATMDLKEFGTIRARFGWAFGQFLPYATAGLAIARVNYTRSATVDYPPPVYGGTPPEPPELPPPPATTCYGAPTNCFTQTKSESRKNLIALGFTGGVGMDVALTQNFFLRGEYQFSMVPVAGMQMFLNSFRAGAGLKF